MEKRLIDGARMAAKRAPTSDLRDRLNKALDEERWDDIPDLLYECARVLRSMAEDIKGAEPN